MWRWWSPSHPRNAQGIAVVRRTSIPSSAFAKWEGCTVYHIMMNFTRNKRPPKGFETRDAKCRHVLGDSGR